MENTRITGQNQGARWEYRRSNCPHRIDFDQAARHLAALDKPGIRFLFAMFPEAPGTLGPVRHLLGMLAAVRADLQNAQRHGCGVFVTINAMAGQRRRKTDVTSIRSLWCERDQPGRRLPLPSSIRVGTSPGRGHDYLICDPDDPPSPAEAERMNRLIADEYGGDRQACDVARVLRLAGTWHLKGEPFKVQVVGGSGEVYDRRTLLDAFPIPPPPPRPRIEPPRVLCEDRYVQAAIHGVLTDLSQAPQGQRNATLNRAAFRLGQLGLDVESATSFLSPTAAGIGLGSDEIAGTIQSGVTAGAQNLRKAA